MYPWLPKLYTPLVLFFLLSFTFLTHKYHFVLYPGFRTLSSISNQGPEDYPQPVAPIFFGHHLPRGKLVLEANVSTSQTGADPFEVARAFIRRLHQDDPALEFTIRPDSYFDQTSGIAHVYAKQTVENIEVEGGDMNMNIRMGRVISYGGNVCCFSYFIHAI